MNSLLETEIQELEATLNNKRRKLNEYNPYFKEFQKYLTKDVIKIVVEYCGSQFCPFCKSLFYTCFPCCACRVGKSCLSYLSPKDWIWSKNDVNLKDVIISNNRYDITFKFNDKTTLDIYHVEENAKKHQLGVIKSCDGFRVWIIVDKNDKLVLDKVAKLLKLDCKCYTS